MRKAIWSLLLIILAVLFSSDDLRARISTELGCDYSTWLIIKSASLCAGLYLALWLFGLIGRLWHIGGKSQIPFKHTIWELLCRLVTLVFRVAALALPLLISIAYFMYFDVWAFTLNKFDGSRIGILIADFREVPLTDVIPYKYSQRIKTRLPEVYLYCIPKELWDISTTPAFIVSKEEAREYGKKVGAHFVVWGDVSRSERTIAIQTNITGMVEYGVGIMHDSTSAVEYPADDSFYQTFETLPPNNIDTVIMHLSNVLFPFVVFLAKQGHHDTQFRKLLECSLQSRLPWPPLISWVLNFEMAFRNFLLDSNDVALRYFKSSLHYIKRVEKKYNPNIFASYTAYVISDIYESLRVTDSARAYLRLAVEWNPKLLLARDLPVLYQSYVSFAEYDEPLRLLGTLWAHTKDTIVGDLMIYLYELRYEKSGAGYDSSFLLEYMNSFPGRLDALLDTTGSGSADSCLHEEPREQE